MKTNKKLVEEVERVLKHYSLNNWNDLPINVWLKHRRLDVFIEIVDKRMKKIAKLAIEAGRKAVLEDDEQLNNWIQQARIEAKAEGRQEAYDEMAKKKRVTIRTKYGLVSFNVKALKKEVKHNKCLC